MNSGFRHCLVDRVGPYGACCAPHGQEEPGFCALFSAESAEGSSAGLGKQRGSHRGWRGVEGPLCASLEGRARLRLGQSGCRPDLRSLCGGQCVCVCVCFNSELLHASMNARFMEAEETLPVFPFQAKPAHSFWPGKASLLAPSPRSGSMMEQQQRFGRHET